MTDLEALFNFTDFQRNGYADCSSEIFSECGIQYNEDHQAEILRVNTSRQLNEINLVEAERVRFTSKFLLNDTLNELISLTAGGLQLVSKCFSCPLACVENCAVC